jgi:hypothetical protein
MHQMTADRLRYMEHCRSQRHLKAELTVLSNSKTWWKPICQSRNGIPSCCNESRKVETMVLKLGDHDSSNSV